MARKAGSGDRNGKAAPVLTLPPGELDAKTRRQLQQTIEAQWRDATGKAKPAPRPFRFRYQLYPLCWLAAAAAGLACRAGHAYLTGVLTALGTVLITVLATRARAGFPRRYSQGMAAWCCAWAVILMAAGLGPWAVIGLAGWAAPSGLWLHHYRWRGPAPKAPAPDTTVEDTWARLCTAQKWAATLGPRRPLPGGGAQWEIVCDGISTHIDKITVKRNEVAAAYHKSITEAYTEPARTGIKSHGMLTILPRGSLETPRPWDGSTIDPATGLAVIGRFPDGQDVHARFYAPGVGGGVRHSIIAGADGTGKTGLLDLLLAIGVSSGQVCPVILDPQEGQALPAWQDVVPYACGAEECMTWLRGLHAAMFEQSRELAQLWWTHPGTGRRRKGIGFYDYDIIARARAEAAGVDAATAGWEQIAQYALPVVSVVVDESPVLLAMKGAAALLLDIAKLGRKVGFQLILAAQVPSIAELGKGELRSILNGGNVVCYRTGDKLSAGMAGIPANPNELPLVWSDGITPTAGLGFAKTVDGRPSVTMRTDWLEDAYTFAEEAAIPGLPATVAARVAAAVAVETDNADQLARAADDAARVQMEVLMILRSGPASAGEVISASALPVSAIVEALEALEAGGRIRKTGDRLQVVGP
jgi:hypothetical protein